MDAVRTFVMLRVEGGGLVLLPLTKPEQPVIAPSGASEANNRNTSPKKEEQEHTGLERCLPRRFNDLEDAIAIFPALAFLLRRLVHFEEGDELNREQQLRLKVLVLISSGQSLG